jgi:Protein of unknown function (DUF4241)
MSDQPVSLEQRMLIAVAGNKAHVQGRDSGIDTVASLRRIDAGILSLPTGRICVTDAYSADKFPALNRIVSPGGYSVQLVIVELPKELPFGNDRCAFAVVTASGDKVVKWEVVTAVESADPCFTDKNPNGFVQEGGTGIFSPEAGAVHFAHLSQQFDQQVADIRKQSKHYGKNDWINYRPGQDPPNVVICEGGNGDGDYQCFVGLTKSGRVACFIVDFGIPFVGPK